MRKIISITIMALIISVSIISSSGNIIPFDDITPPVSSHTMVPAEPDGDNGWYVSDVEVTVTAYDDESGVKEIRYKIDYGSWQNISGDSGVFIIDVDKKDVQILYYAVDNAGNEEEINSFTIDMDQKRPEGDSFHYGIYVNGSKLFVRFIVQCYDITSGINRVEFYINDSLAHTDFNEPYEWIINDSEFSPGVEIIIFDNAGNYVKDDNPLYAGWYSLRGIILNPEISEDNVTFFAFWTRYKHLEGWGIPDQGVHRFTWLSFPNNYAGYIGKFFIRATFYF